jgi:hypothetical protein
MDGLKLRESQQQHAGIGFVFRIAGDNFPRLKQNPKSLQVRFLAETISLPHVGKK